jgi:hypothetical protein
MSSSSLKRPMLRSPILRYERALIWAMAALAAPPALAAEFFYQPIVSIQAEADSNLDLDPGVKQWVEGYIADAATLIGIATPNTDTIIKPRIIYRDYPQDSADDRLEAHLDFNTDYRSQRSSASLSGSIQHVDEFNAEQTAATYNDVNPGQPVNVDTGKITNGSTRDSAFLAPKYLYNITPVIGVGATGQVQVVSYSPSDENHNDYDYYQARAYMRWAFSQSSDAQLGGFGSKFDATHLGDSATGGGATLDFNTSWTPLLSTKASLIYQHTNITDNVTDKTPEQLKTDNNAWGATFGVLYKTQLDQFRLDVGRTISPSGSGGLYNVDRVQFQDDRTLTTRLSITGAVVGLKTHALTANIAGDDRKYAQAIVEMRWMVTRYWFVQGGYQYAWQRYQFDTDSAANNRVYLLFGYQGLPRQR